MAGTAFEPEARYLTDGRVLYRHLGPTWVTRGSPLVPLEDCRSLTVVLVPAKLCARLRDVIPFPRERPNARPR